MLPGGALAPMLSVVLTFGTWIRRRCWSPGLHWSGASRKSATVVRASMLMSYLPSSLAGRVGGASPTGVEHSTTACFPGVLPIATDEPGTRAADASIRGASGGDEAGVAGDVGDEREDGVEGG